MQTATPPHVISRVVSDSQRGLAVTNLVWAKHPNKIISLRLTFYKRMLRPYA
jgi:hypothetical protein